MQSLDPTRPAGAAAPVPDPPASESSSRSKPPFLASLAISPFSAFRSQPSNAPPTQSPIRRKPLPPDSPVVARYSQTPSTKNQSNAAGDKGTGNIVYNPPANVARRSNAAPFPPLTDDDLFIVRNLDDNPHGNTPQTATAPKFPFKPRKSSLSYSITNRTSTGTLPRHERSSSRLDQTKGSRISLQHVRSPTMPNMPMYTSEPRQQQNLRLKLDGVTEDFIEEDIYETEQDRVEEARPVKPNGGGFSSFFGWNASKQTGPESPTTSFSDSPVSPSATTAPRNPNMPPKAKPSGLDIPMANSMAQQSYFNIPGTPLLSSSPQMNAHVEELERELREVSSELAASIQREMELEDEVEKWKAESSSATSVDNRRTSDYYSDSGTSSIRFPIGDAEGKLEELEMLRRKAEQERAQLKLTMAERLQEELRRRRDLEEQVQQLEDQVSGPSAQSGASGATVKELEASLEDAKRRLAEERQVKENFEDLLTALRGELEKHRNERDNLRDEIVPQLRARLEGLEAEAADTQGLIYESSRMQQEIQNLRNENQALSRRLQQEGGSQQVRFSAIAEENDGSSTQRVGLSRSNSLARSLGFGKRNSLQRSASVKDRSGGESPREGPAAGNPVKELEEQRDALHKALKHLLQRQEMQQRDFEKRIKELEAERDSALNLTPRRTAFHKEVSTLRTEMNSLRRRADDALEQKWQCENGLRGLRMDLDRAQQETTSLRDLLKENDITIPEIRVDDQSISLDKSYHELRTTHALSIARIKQMESEDSLGAAGEEAQKTLDLLKRSISDAEAERDFAQKEAEQYRRQARDLQRSELAHLGKEQKLSADLLAAASRMDELSDKIQQQLSANTDLRKRLAEAVSRGEQDQEKSTGAIIELERRLKAAEDKVMVAQQSSEEAIARHEEEVKAIRENYSSSLRRTKSGLLSPNAPSAMMPTSPIFAQRSPRLDQTTSGPAMTMAEATRTQMLEKRVEELEKALRDADHEMEEVVGRMNMAQMEVADLQYQRDEAMRNTRKLQADILAEREKVKTLMAEN